MARPQEFITDERLQANDEKLTHFLIHRDCINCGKDHINIQRVLATGALGPRNFCHKQNEKFWKYNCRNCSTRWSSSNLRT